MRERIFRAKRTDNGEWVKGFYVRLHKTTVCCGPKPPDNEIHQIVFERMTDWNLPNKYLRVDVDPETVGEFAGHEDKTGRRIFEGDVVRTDFENAVAVVKFGEYQQSCRGGDKNIGFYLQWQGKSAAHQLRRDLGFFEDLTVIGNVFDNPELADC